MSMSWSWSTNRATQCCFLPSSLPSFLTPEKEREVREGGWEGEREREQFFDVLDVNNDDVMSRAELTQLFDAVSAVPSHAHTRERADTHTHSRERAFSKERSTFRAHLQILSAAPVHACMHKYMRACLHSCYVGSGLECHLIQSYYIRAHIPACTYTYMRA
jgi:hypothetical protein